MGLFDLFSSTARKKRDAAIAVGLNTGLFQQCPVCREVTEKQTDKALLQETERQAEHMLTNADARVAAYRGDAEGLKEQIREIRKKGPL